MAGTMKKSKIKHEDGTKVSMESGLDGRNNWAVFSDNKRQQFCLNGVRPRWPEQCDICGLAPAQYAGSVSMESGLDGRNNVFLPLLQWSMLSGLNGVRPRWPEQSIVRIDFPASLDLSQWSPA